MTLDGLHVSRWRGHLADDTDATAGIRAVKSNFLACTTAVATSLASLDLLFLLLWQNGMIDFLVKRDELPAFVTSGVALGTRLMLASDSLAFDARCETGKATSAGRHVPSSLETIGTLHAIRERRARMLVLPWLVGQRQKAFGAEMLHGTRKTRYFVWTGGLIKKQRDVSCCQTA